MKKGYTEDEYRSFQTMNETDDELDGHASLRSKKHAVTKTEYERRKKERAEREEDAKRASVAVLVAAVAFLVLSLVAVGISIIVKNGSAESDVEEKHETVLTIGEEEIGADLFTMFCVNVIEGPEFERLMKTSMNDTNLIKQIKEKAISYACEYVCLHKEAEKIGIVLTEAEKTAVENECASAVPPDMTAEEYYRTNYGVSYETYVEVRGNWILADKYLALLRAKCDTSEEHLKKVYDTHYSSFAKADVTMVYFDTSSTDDGSNGFVKSNAETVFNEISVSGDGRYTADNSKLAAAVKEHSSENIFYSSGENADGKTTVTGAHSSNYPNLYETVIGMKLGEVKLVHDKTASFIVRCDGLTLFDDVKDSAELKNFAQEKYAEEVYRAARYSGAYDAEKTDDFSSVKIEDYVLEGKAHYGR